MSSASTVSRREFLKSGAAATGGLVIALHFSTLAPSEAALASPASEFIPNAFVKIAPDGARACIPRSP